MSLDDDDTVCDKCLKWSDTNSFSADTGGISHGFETQIKHKCISLYT